MNTPFQPIRKNINRKFYETWLSSILSPSSSKKYVAQKFVLFYVFQTFYIQREE